MAEPSSMSKFTIDPLNGPDDFSTWSIFIKELSNGNILIGYIDGFRKERPEEEEELLKTFKEKDRLATSNIVLNLRKEAATNVESILAEDASEKRVSIRLKDVYKKDNLRAVLNLQSILYKGLYKVREEINKNFQKFEAEFVKRASFGTPMPKTKRLATYKGHFPNHSHILPPWLGT